MLYSLNLIYYTKNMSKKKNSIKCTFFGFTMAETKRNKIIRFLKKNNYDFEETYDYKIIVRNITFEGFHTKITLKSAE